MKLYGCTIHIQIPKNNDQALAFRIMKTAYDCRVMGECRYDHKHLRIVAEGEKNKLIDFINILRKSFSPIDIHSSDFIHTSTSSYKEFDLYHEQQLELLT
jgi:hydrogenase maturation factor HypF (carbamoyltransferase family)